MLKRLDQLIAILVEPRTAGNIGAVARAMKTMGLSRLRLVSPVPYQQGEARWLAHGSTDILDQAQSFTTLAEAVHDVDFIVAASGREGEKRGPTLTPEEVAPRLLRHLETHSAAILFGREDNGLTNDEIAISHAVIKIPAATRYPSLNLAQAAMVIFYEIYIATQSVPPSKNVEKAESTFFEPLIQRVAVAMENAGFQSRVTPATFRTSLRRALERSNLSANDIKTIHKALDLLSPRK